MGINSYIKSDSTPIPTGSEEVFEMKTMDFEEFLWANGYIDSQIEGLVEHFEKKIPIEENIHHLFKNLYLKYACVSGFPKAVATFVETHNIIDSFKVVNNILLEMKADFGRQKDKNGNPIFNKSEVSRIQNVFDLIPAFLAKENKRYIVSKIKGGNQYDKNDSIEYLK